MTQVVAETTGTDVTRYVHDPRGLLATQQNGSTWTWGVLDALGSQRAQVSGGLVAARHFSEYGVVQGQHGTFSNPMAFTGEPLDANGLQYHRARYYAPTLGIFPSLDPFEGMTHRPMSLNGYSWVEGNPVMNVDPSGMCIQADTCDNIPSNGNILEVLGCLEAASCNDVHRNPEIYSSAQRTRCMGNHSAATCHLENVSRESCQDCCRRADFRSPDRSTEDNPAGFEIAIDPNGNPIMPATIRALCEYNCMSLASAYSVTRYVVVGARFDYTSFTINNVSFDINLEWQLVPHNGRNGLFLNFAVEGGTFSEGGFNAGLVLGLVDWPTERGMLSMTYTTGGSTGLLATPWGIPPLEGDVTISESGDLVVFLGVGTPIIPNVYLALGGTIFLGETEDFLSGNYDPMPAVNAGIELIQRLIQVYNAGFR